jgi:hypothetical protein
MIRPSYGSIFRWRPPTTGIPLLLRKEVNKSRKYLGDSSCNVILINTVVPMFFVYGQKTGQEKFCERAMQLLESLNTGKKRYHYRI